MSDEARSGGIDLRGVAVVQAVADAITAGRLARPLDDFATRYFEGDESDKEHIARRGAILSMRLHEIESRDESLDKRARAIRLAAMDLGFLAPRKTQRETDGWDWVVLVYRGGMSAEAAVRELARRRGRAVEAVAKSVLRWFRDDLGIEPPIPIGQYRGE